MLDSSIEIRPVSGALGAEVLGVDLSELLSDHTIAQIRQALLDHLVIFFRGQSITPAQHLAFSRRFGKLSIYPFVEGMQAYPEIVEVVKREEERHNFGGVWHSDTTYLEVPPLGSTLLAKELPANGGDTLFANMYKAFEALSPAMQHRLRGLRAVNASDKADAAAGRTARLDEKPGLSARQSFRALHPVVRTHPESGREALYINAGHTVNFDGFTIEESQPILEYLFAHLTRPEFSCRFQWRAGSMAFWDNRAAQHYAVNDYHGSQRVMHRVTIEGDRPA